MSETLKPYTGPHAGSLHHVINARGEVERNATELEVRQLAELVALRQQAQRQKVALQEIARMTRTDATDLNALVNAVSALAVECRRKRGQ